MPRRHFGGREIVPVFVKGKGFVPRWRPSKLKVSDETLVALRLKYYGSTGRPRNDSECPGGTEKIAELTGLTRRTVSRRLNKIAREEA